MADVVIERREMTDEELARMNAGFEEQSLEHGNPVDASERFSFVASDEGGFVGCISGLAYKKAVGYGDWFYITDLFVEKPLRGRGLGSELLRRLEAIVAALGIGNVWTWTAGYDGPVFYEKQGYEVFVEMDGWYTSGHSRVGVRKALAPGGPA